MFLDAAEIVTLTGCRRPSLQIAWLRSRQIRHFVNAVGHPVIARAWLIGDRDAVPLPQRPNLQALKARA